MNTPDILAKTAQHSHLSLEERAAILNMIRGDRTKAAELLVVVANILAANEPDFERSEALRGAVMDASRFVREAR